MFKNPDDSVIREIFSKHRTIAVVGCSPKPIRDSNSIAQLLISRGHKVIPVNPGHHEILGLHCYRSLLDIPEPVEIVDVFRRSEYVPEIAQQTVAIGAKILWTQLGVWSEEAAKIAQQGGVTVIMDRCPAIEFRRLSL